MSKEERRGRLTSENIPDAPCSSVAVLLSGGTGARVCGARVCAQRWDIFPIAFTDRLKAMEMLMV
jgi:hypothetical protein